MDVAAFVAAATLVFGSPAAPSSAERHTTAGELALEAGDDATAAAEFAAAYELLEHEQCAGEIGIMLVDEGVAAGQRAWKASGDAAHLERARALLLLHAEDLEHVPEASSRHQEIVQRLVELDAELGIENADMDSPEGTRTPLPPPDRRAATERVHPVTPTVDRVRERLTRERLAGWILIPSGSALAISGFVVVGYYAFLAKLSLAKELDALEDFSEIGCEETPGDPACFELTHEADLMRRRGQHAKSRVVAGAMVGVVGLIAASVGVGLLVTATRRLKRLDGIALRPTAGGWELRF
jgi:hypothetical protein